MAVLTPLNFSDVAQAFQEAGRYLRVNPLPAGTGWVVAEFIVYTLIAAAVSILQIYTAISIGHLGKKNRGFFKARIPDFRRLYKTLHTKTSS